MKTSLLLSLFSLFIVLGLQAQEPVNDNCADALSLSVGSSCTTQAFTSIGATNEGTAIAANPTCGAYIGADVWFTFEVPASGNFRIEMTSAGNNSQWALYSGTCGNFTQLDCASSGNQLSSNFSDPSLAGETLYLRAWRFGNSSGIAFDLCIWEIVPPANNNCSDAIGLSVGETCNFQSFSSQLSTAESVSVAPNPTCGGYQGADVWFSFEVPASGNFRIEMTSAGNNSQWALYSGTCGDFTQMECASSGNQLSSNFSDPVLAGETLYLRAWRFGNSSGIAFDLCIWEIDPPVNDDCANATILPVGSECNLQNYSSQFSTSEDSGVASNPSCGIFQGGDVWFTFEVPASGDFRIELNDISTGFAYWTLYSGTCGNFTELACSASNTNFSEPGLAGQTLYLRIYRFNSIQGNDFSLCVWEIDPPVNDNCANATILPVGSECNLQNYSSQFSTSEDSGVASNPSCGIFQGGDVWFTFEVPASGDFRIELNDISTGFAYWTLYSGTCGNFTELACSASNTNFSDPSLAGQTLYLRLYRFNSIQGNDFSLCVWEIDPPVNNACADAIWLDVSEECNAGSYSSQFATTEDLSVAANPSCGVFQGGDVWFAFEAPGTGQFAVERTHLSGSTTNLAVYSGSCGNFTQLACSGNPSISFNDPALGGETLYIRAWAFNSIQGSDFELCVVNTTVAVNDNCADAIALDVNETCVFETFNNYNTTEELGIAPTPLCGAYQGGDVWFTFEVPASGQFTLRVNGLTSGFFPFAIYSGSCGNLTEQQCSNAGGQMNVYNISSIGQTFYMRAWRLGTPLGGEFEVCIEELTCTGDFTFDGAVNTSDLLFLLGSFGCSTGQCVADLTGAGTVGTGDLLIFLSLFASPC